MSQSQWQQGARGRPRETSRLEPPPAAPLRPVGALTGASARGVIGAERYAAPASFAVMRPPQDPSADLTQRSPGVVSPGLESMSMSRHPSLSGSSARLPGSSKKRAKPPSARENPGGSQPKKRIPSSSSAGIYRPSLIDEDGGRKPSRYSSSFTDEPGQVQAIIREAAKLSSAKRQSQQYPLSDPAADAGTAGDYSESQGRDPGMINYLDAVLKELQDENRLLSGQVALLQRLLEEQRSGGAPPIVAPAAPQELEGLRQLKSKISAMAKEMDSSSWVMAKLSSTKHAGA